MKNGYTDTVLAKDLKPLFNGSPEETKQWLEANDKPGSGNVICDGRKLKLMTVADYLEKGNG